MAVSINGGPFTDLADNAVFSGVTTASLTVNNVTAAMDNYRFQVVLARGGNICGSQSAIAALDVNPLPPSTTKTLVQCDTGTSPDGITIFNLDEATSMMTGGNTNLSVSYFLNLTDAQSGTGALSNDYTNISNPQALSVRITDSASGCFSFSTLNLSVNLLPNQVINLPQACEVLGEEDGFLIFDLTQAGIPVSGTQTIRYYVSETDALLEQNQIPDPTQYQNLVPYTAQTIYARIESGNDCSRLYLINIKVNPLPAIDPNLELIPFVVCVNTPTFNTTLTVDFLDGSSASNYDFQWYFEGSALPGETDSTLAIDTEGLYSVEVTDGNGCSKTRTIPVVASSEAIIEDISIIDMVDSNTVTVTLTPNSYGDYVYSIDHQNAFQTSNVLTNVPMGIHTVYVKDLDGCPTASQVISVLGIPKYFTPNGDGFNETWSVKGISSQFHPGTITYIFNRHGKLIKEIGAAGEGWNGTFNGQPLPSDDYWYVVKFDDGRTVKGHFSLKR